MANAKCVILKAKIENELVELLVKSRVDNIYLEDGTTTLASKLADILVAMEAKADSEDVTTQISNAIAGIVDDAPEAYNTLKEISDYLGTHEEAYEALVELVGDKATNATVEALASRVTAVETKLKDIAEGAQVNVIEKVTVNGVEQAITDKAVDITVPTGALAGKDEVSEAELSAELKEKLNVAADGTHNHENKTVLDGITSDKVTAWDGKADIHIQQSQPINFSEGSLWVQIVE